jgi:hypothetical protein
MKLTTLLLLTLLLGSGTSADAYLDPGSGSMMLQLLLGGVAGIGVILKLYWTKILTALGMRRAADEPAGRVTPDR